jgi:hypothetical protein
VVAGSASQFVSATWAKNVALLTKEVIDVLAIAGRISVEKLQSFLPGLGADLSRLFDMAHGLSVATRRDMLSVEMVVTQSYLYNKVFDDRYAKLHWPMDPKPDDRIIANYSLGLWRTTSTGQSSPVYFPRVVTSALLRAARRHIIQ